MQEGFVLMLSKKNLHPVRPMALPSMSQQESHCVFCSKIVASFLSLFVDKSLLGDL